MPPFMWHQMAQLGYNILQELSNRMPVALPPFSSSTSRSFNITEFHFTAGCLPFFMTPLLPAAPEPRCAAVQEILGATVVGRNAGDHISEADATSDASCGAEHECLPCFTVQHA